MPFIEKDIWQRHKSDSNFVLMGIDRDEPLDKVITFAQSVGISYPLALDPGADVFAKYMLFVKPVSPAMCLSERMGVL